MEKTFQEYRNIISLIDVAVMLHYWKNPRGGQKCYTYTLGDVSNPVDEICIYNVHNSGEMTYFSRMNSADKGNLINFILNRLDQFSHRGIGFYAVNDVLAKLAGEGGISHQQEDTNSRGNKASTVKAFNINDYDISVAKVTEVPFLTNVRKISERTVQDFCNIFSIYKVYKKPSSFYNCGFPYRMPGKAAINNFELRNYNSLNNANFKGFCSGGNKSDSCWIANFCPIDQITEVFFFESAIDAMSFYELREYDKNCKCALISFGGNLVRTQVSPFKSYFKNAAFRFCFDNDVQGNIYDVESFYWLQDINCKIFRKNGEISIEVDKKIEILNEKDFSSASYFANKNKYCEIMKPGHKRKDWNEELVYLKRINE